MDITCVEISMHLSLMASGDSNGHVVVWDLELTKVDGVLFGHKGAINDIKFIQEYPLLVTASADSTLAIWAVRPAPIEIRNVCLTRFMNIHIKRGEPPETGISKICILQGEQRGITQ